MSGARSFDFRSAPADEDLLKRKCEQLQSRETSIFVQNLICQRPTGNTIYQLRGRVLRTLRHDGFDERLIEDLAEFEAMMASVFGLTDPEMPRLWDKVSDRHRQIFP